MRKRLTSVVPLAALVLLAISAPALGGNVLIIGDFDLDIFGDGSIAGGATDGNANMIADSDDALIAATQAHPLVSSVTIVEDGIVTKADLVNKHLVIVSGTASSNNVLNNVGDLSNRLFSLINMEPGLADDMGFNTNANTQADNFPPAVTDIAIVNNVHPITSSFALGATTVFTSPQNWVSHATTTITPGFLFPPSIAVGVDVLAEVANGFGSQSAVLVSANPGVLAPGKRIGFFAAKHSFDDLTGVGPGLTLWDDTVTFALTPQVPEPSSFVLAAMGSAFGLALIRRRNRRK